MNTPILPLVDTCVQEALIFRNLSPRTVSWWSSTYRCFCRYTGTQYLEEITEETIRAFLLHGRTERNWSAHTQSHYFRGLAPFLKWCLKRGYLSKNPLELIDSPRLPQLLPKRIGVKEAQLILDTCINLPYVYHFQRYRNHAFLSTLVFTGLRLREALNLNLQDVDLNQNLLYVRSGKGKRDRLVPICIQLRLSLLRYLQDRTRLKRKCIRFFTSVRGDIPFTDSGVKGVIIRIRKASKVHFSAHRLRHTFATLMLEQGCDLFSLSRMLGHSDIKTTTLYLSTSVAHLQKEIHKHPLNLPPVRGTSRRPGLPGDVGQLYEDTAES